MGRHRLTDKELRAIFPLLLEQPWLEHRFEALTELMNLCSDEPQKSLVYKLLGRFTFLDDERFDIILRAIKSEILDTWALPLGQTQIVATTWDDEADGAQAVLDSLKGVLAEAGVGLRDLKLVNRAGNAISNLYRCPNVVLIDDFVGSGQTVCRRVRQLQTAFDGLIRTTGKTPGIPYLRLRDCMYGIRQG